MKRDTIIHTIAMLISAVVPILLAAGWISPEVAAAIVAAPGSFLAGYHTLNSTSVSNAAVVKDLATLAPPVGLPETPPAPVYTNPLMGIK